MKGEKGGKHKRMKEVAGESLRRESEEKWKEEREEEKKRGKGEWEDGGGKKYTTGPL